MIICCVKWGEKYSPYYVNALFKGIARNFDKALQFICFTDDPRGVEYECVTLPGNLHGWWNKLYLFKKGVFPKNERVVFFDLDTVITGNLGDILSYGGEFGILRDPLPPPERVNSSLMIWTPSRFLENIWENYSPKAALGLRSDQDWMQKFLGKGTHDILDDFYPGQIKSYTWDWLQDGYGDARIVNFYGKAKPHGCTGWVPEIWMSA